jgi:hypothetical protein
MAQSSSTRHEAPDQSKALYSGMLANDPEVAALLDACRAFS